MKKSISKIFIAFAFGIGFFSLQSCKERSVTKTDMIPPVDNINTFEITADSLYPEMRIGHFDSVKTNRFDPDLDPIIALGMIENDPFFGKISAGLYTQFYPPVSGFSFPDPAEYTFDSALLVLPYYGIDYGDTTNLAGNYLAYNVYRVTEPLKYNDSDSYTFSDYSYHQTPIGGSILSLKNIRDSFIAGEDTLVMQMRIKLDRDYIYQTIVSADADKVSNIGSFADYFNGWYIMPVSHSAGVSDRISYFALSGGNSLASGRVDFFFRNAKDEVKIYTFRYSPPVTPFVNKITRNYTGSPLLRLLEKNRTIDSVILSGEPGIYTDVSIRNIKNIPASVINKAEIVFNAIPIGGDQKYIPPAHLLVERVLPSGETVPIKDILGMGSYPVPGGYDFLNGRADKVTIDGQKYIQYRMNFPRELQRAMMEGEDSLVLRITVNSLYLGAYRMLAPGFHGGGKEKMKINIIYTKLK